MSKKNHNKKGIKKKKKKKNSSHPQEPNQSTQLKKDNQILADIKTR